MSGEPHTSTSATDPRPSLQTPLHEPHAESSQTDRIPMTGSSSGYYIINEEFTFTRQRHVQWIHHGPSVPHQQVPFDHNVRLSNHQTGQNYGQSALHTGRASAPPSVSTSAVNPHPHPHPHPQNHVPVVKTESPPAMLPSSSTLATPSDLPKIMLLYVPQCYKCNHHPECNFMTHRASDLTKHIERLDCPLRHCYFCDVPGCPNRYKVRASWRAHWKEHLAGSDLPRDVKTKLAKRLSQGLGFGRVASIPYNHHTYFSQSLPRETVLRPISPQIVPEGHAETTSNPVHSHQLRKDSPPQHIATGSTSMQSKSIEDSLHESRMSPESAALTLLDIRSVARTVGGTHRVHPFVRIGSIRPSNLHQYRDPK